MLTISTWFVGDPSGVETEFPQMGLRSSSDRFQRIYWQCTWLFFRTARASNSDARLVLFVDNDTSSLCGEFRPALGKLSVEIIPVRFTSRPPKGFTNSFGNQLYICDIVRAIASSERGDSVWLVLDSDCLILDPLGELTRAAQKEGVLTMDLELPLAENINGLTQVELGGLARELRLIDTARPLTYYGGEFFAATADKCRVLAPLLDRLLAANVERWRGGALAIKEEAHLLSLAYHHLGIAKGTANSFIRRIWTTFKYNTVSKSDLALPIWHVPAEKRLGLHRLYRWARRHPQEFDRSLLGGTFKALAGRFVGIPKRTLRKTACDAAVKILRRLRCE